MKVKIGNDVYGGYDQPVMVILTDRDKRKISELDVEDDKYCHYPTGMKIEDINIWMNQEGEKNVNPLQSLLDDQTKLIIKMENKIESLKPVLLDMYVCALLAGGIVFHKESPDNVIIFPFDTAMAFIKERNKRLNAKPKKSPVRILREDEADVNVGTKGLKLSRQQVWEERYAK